MNGTPILDIKPYLPNTDCIPDAKGGFSTQVEWKELQVEISDELLELLPEANRETIINLLSQDPRPAYHNDPNKVYGVRYGEQNIRFTIEENILKVIEIK